MAFDSCHKTRGKKVVDANVRTRFQVLYSRQLRSRCRYGRCHSAAQDRHAQAQDRLLS